MEPDARRESEMAYMSAERKAKMVPVVKAICARHGVKATLSVRHHSTIVLTVSEGRVDFLADRTEDRWGADAAAAGHVQINPYHYADHFRGAAAAFLAEVMPALNDGNHDRSDLMTDYFDVGWYVDVNVGRWDKPYRLTAAPAALAA